MGSVAICYPLYKKCREILIFSAKVIVQSATYHFEIFFLFYNPQTSISRGKGHSARALPADYLSNFGHKELLFDNKPWMVKINHIPEGYHSYV